MMMITIMQRRPVGRRKHTTYRHARCPCATGQSAPAAHETPSSLLLLCCMLLHIISGISMR